MVNMTVKEAISYILKGNGMDYTEELQKKIDKFIKSLPHNPKHSTYTHFSDITFHTVCVTDYEKGWFSKVSYGYNKGKVIIDVIKSDMLDKSEKRVKCNKEALELLKEYNDVQFADDIDWGWHMSDDYSTIEWGNKVNSEAYATRERISQKL